MHDPDSDTDDLDFAMLIPPTRPGPCKAATAPEVDPVAARLELEQVKQAFLRPAEVKHGSGKVKV